MKTRDRYLKLVEWSDEDRCYVGTCPELFEGGVHGQNEAKVYKELCQAVDEWIRLLEKDKVPLPKSLHQQHYSGKFVLRLPQPLHKALAVRAMQAGESLNQYCLKKLSPRPA